MNGAGAGAPLLAVDAVSVRYRERLALDRVSLVAEAGQIIALLGPNGAGKSTLMQCMAGQRRPHAGQIRLAGADPLHDAAARSRVGIVPQALAVFPELSVAENLRAFARLMGVRRADIPARVAATLERVGLTGRADDTPEALSGGMQRLLNLAAGLLHGPSLLLLDEPTVGIDRQARHRFRDLLRTLRAEGLTIVLTTHELEEAELLAERVVVLAAGRLLASGETRSLIGSAFGERRELRLTLAAGPGPELAALFARLDLQQGHGDGIWRGLVDPGASDCRRLIELCRDEAAGVAELRVRRPGLGRLLDHLQAQPGRPGS